MNIDQDTTETETQPDIDMAAATADISSELFGQGDNEDDKSEAEGEELESSGDSLATGQDEVPPQTETEAEDKSGEAASTTEEGGDNSAEVQAAGAPKTWTKEALETWATIPERAQQEILKREEDFMRGISQYKQAADLGVQYDTVVQPYRPMLEQGGIDPVQLFQSFAANHYLLTRGTPEQKIELAATMLQGYEIPLPELLNFMADNLSEPVDPKVTALEKELAEIKSSLNVRATAENTQRSEAIAQEIEAFAADPAHPYFQELATDIQKLFETGLVTNLNDAYDRAVYANPVTRQKEIDRLTTEKLAAERTAEQARADKKARLTGDHVTTIPKQRNGTVPLGSIDDTLNETMAAITSRG
jgi:hypothetical protein